MRIAAAAVAVLVLGTSFAAAPAFGQAPPAQVPPSAIAPSPSVIGREVLEEKAAPAGKAAIDVPAPGAVQVSSELAARTVTFHHVAVEGSSAFIAQEFAPLFAPILNRTVPFSQVAAAVNGITALYAREGYVFYSVALPQQDLGGDTLYVVVLEGSVSGIEVQDGIASPAMRQQIVDLLSKLKDRRPLKRGELERRLLLAADLPGVALQASAKPDPSGAPGKVVLVVGGSFERLQPIATVDSFQTTPDTAINFRVGAIERSVLTGGDSAELRYVFGLPWDRLQLIDARYSLPVGLDGGRLGFLGQAVWQRPPATFNGQSIDFLGRSFLGRVSYSQPIVRRLDWSIVGLAMLDVIGVDYTIGGIGVPGDSLRVLRGGGSAGFKDDWEGRWTATLLASTGLDVANAAANNRFGASPSFFKANLSLERLQPLGSHFALMTRGVAQLSAGTVPAAEVFAFGGRDFGRAFNVSESVGDRGAAVSAELRYAIDWLGLDKDKVEPQAYVFADHGWIWSADPMNAPLFAQASSAGAGVRVRAWKKYTGEIELAKALDAGPLDTSARPWRVSFRIGTNF